MITFHPINFWQWLYFLVAIIILPFYISGLTNLGNKQKISRKMLLTCLIYIADTICGFLYTVYFMYFWFNNEDTSAADETIQSRAYDETATVQKSSQSASQSREMFFIFSSTIVITAIRLYLTLVILSFTKSLLKQELSENYYRPDDGSIPNEDVSTGSSKLLAKIKYYLLKAEMKSKELLINFFK